MYWLDDDLCFPHPSLAGEDGLLAAGGDLTPERLMLAYSNGIFPWYDLNCPILWWSPEKRMVVNPHTYDPPKSLKNFLKNKPFDFTWNCSFEEVVRSCQKSVRKGQEGTWINEDIVSAYVELHRLGHAKSVEVWQNDTLVGGLYGVQVGTVFSGESMFSSVSNASKAGFVWLVQYLCSNNYQLLDCQLYNDHLALLGAYEIDRVDFLKILDDNTSLLG